MNKSELRSFKIFKTSLFNNANFNIISDCLYMILLSIPNMVRVVLKLI